MKLFFESCCFFSIVPKFHMDCRVMTLLDDPLNPDIFCFVIFYLEIQPNIEGALLQLALNSKVLVFKVVLKLKNFWAKLIVHLLNQNVVNVLDRVKLNFVIFSSLTHIRCIFTLELNLILALTDFEVLLPKRMTHNLLLCQIRNNFLLWEFYRTFNQITRQLISILLSSLKLLNQFL